MTAKTAINRQDLAALAAACKFTDKKRPILAVVRVRLDADGLRCQSTDSFRAFGYVRADAAPADESAFFDVSVNAAALAAACKGRALALVYVDGGALVVTDGATESRVRCEDVARADMRAAVDRSRHESGDAGTVRLNLAYIQDAAAALKSVFGKKAWALVDSSHGPRSAATVTAGNGDALASVVVMPVNAPETCDASAAFIEGR